MQHHPTTIGGLIRGLTISIHRRIELEFSKYNVGDIKGPQFMALTFLIDQSKKGEVFTKDVEKFLNIRKSTASELVNRLIKNGYVRSEKSETDGRLKRLIVTEGGHAIHTQLHEIFKELENELTRGFSEEQRALFEKMLAKSIKNMQL